jgi:hypothetical protein
VEFRVLLRVEGYWYGGMRARDSDAGGCHAEAAMRRGAGGQIRLPLAGAADEMQMLRENVADRPVMSASAGSAKEYGVG